MNMTASTVDLSAWQGRIDTVDGPAGRRWHQVVQAIDPSARHAGTALLGFACDAGVARNHGRSGAATGPQVLRRHLANLAWHGTASARLYDAGDVHCEGDQLESAQAAYAARLAGLLRAGHRVVGIGGGHEIAWASYQGIAAGFAGDARLHRLGVINFDAHFDLRKPETAERGSSGTPFLQIAEARAAAGLPFHYLCLGISEVANTRALFDRAAALGTRHVKDVDIEFAATESAVQDFVAGCDSIYCTFCLDVLPASVAPGVSAPSGLGVPLHRAVELLRLVLAECRGGTRDKLLMADIAEFNPLHDAEDARTARTAARLVYELSGIGR
jgi:formiminoglutamase